MTESYDVIIIGAGPGGLSCAGELVKSNKSVLLLEKNNIIGPKICAGGIRESDFKHLGLESELRGSEVDQAGCLTVDRKDLAQSQLQKLDTKRIHIRTGSRVERIEEGRLTVHGHQEIRFKYLVGADGSMSIVRRYLKLRQEYVLFALQHLICAKLYDHLGEIKKNQYHYNKRFFLWWYGWIFPHKGYSSVGCGCGRGFLSPKTLKENFSTWLSEMGIGVQAKSPMGFPINCDYRGHEFGNTYLVGDAAGLASYATGEGIHQAIVSGEETAKMIIDPNHKSRKMEGLLSEKKTEDDAFMQIMI